MRRHCMKSLVVLVVLLAGCSLPKLSLLPQKGPLKETTLQGTGEGKVLVISINGLISDQPQERLLRTEPSMVQEVVSQLRLAEKDPQIKAVLFKINSPGGTVTASDIIYHEISRFKAATGDKILVAMMNLTASGGYYISLPADWIMAHPTTVTGSIGVIFARPQISGFMQKLGLAMEVNTSGEQKDMGSPFRPPTEKENAIFQELTDSMARRFYDLVVKNRKLTPEQLKQVSTARVYLADEALKLGLVDQIGYLSEALTQAKKMAGLPEDARVVTYRRHQSEDDNIYSPGADTQRNGFAAAAPFLKPLSAAGETGFYYLWPLFFNP
jgi:protease IV